MAIPGQAAGTVRLSDPDGLVALAEPVPSGSGLRPIVVLRNPG